MQLEIDSSFRKSSLLASPAADPAILDDVGMTRNPRAASALVIPAPSPDVPPHTSAVF